MLQYNTRSQRGYIPDIENDKIFYKEMVVDYLEKCPAIIEDINMAFNDWDFEKKECQVQSLEAASASVGAILMEFVCKKLNETEPWSEPSTVRALLDHLSKEFDETKKAFADFFDNFETRESDWEQLPLDLAG
jgi:hypothetical protein